MEVLLLVEGGAGQRIDGAAYYRQSGECRQWPDPEESAMIVRS